MMKHLLGNMGRDERAGSAVEFALLLPLLLALLLGTVTVFDVFRTSQSAEKGTFTVGDILSRQRVVSTALLGDMLTLIDKTVDNDGRPRLRVSSISNVAGKLELDWSKTAGNQDIVLGSIDYGLVPQIAPGDSVILTETFIPHRAFVAGFGFDHLVFNNKAAHRPRFIGKIAFGGV